MMPTFVEEPALSLRVTAHGDIQWVYDERIDLSSLGPPRLRRASHIEPEADGSWWADLVRVNGPRLGPFPCRSAALTAERAWLEEATTWPPQRLTHSTPPEPLIQRRTQSMRMILIVIVLIFLLSFMGCLDQMAIGSAAHANKSAPATRRSP